MSKQRKLYKKAYERAKKNGIYDPTSIIIHQEAEIDYYRQKIKDYETHHVLTRTQEGFTLEAVPISIPPNICINFKQGDILTHKSLEWYVIKDNETTIDLLPTKVLSEELIKKYVTDEIMRNGFEVRMADTIRPISWKDSFIYKVLLPKIKEDFKAENVTLLSKEEIETLPSEIKACGEWYWTSTPVEYGCPVECATRFAYIGASGDSYTDWGGASGVCGVRPLVSISKGLLEEE